MEQIVTVEETQVKDKKCILLRIKGGKQFVLQCEVGCFLVLFILVCKALMIPQTDLFPLCPQSDPEFVQWKKELNEAFTEAQKLLRRAPKVIGKGRAGVVELSKPPLTHRNSNGLWIKGAHTFLDAHTQTCRHTYTQRTTSSLQDISPNFTTTPRSVCMDSPAPYPHCIPTPRPSEVVYWFLFFFVHGTLPVMERRGRVEERDSGEHRTSAGCDEDCWPAPLSSPTLLPPFIPTPSLGLALMDQRKYYCKMKLTFKPEIEQDDQSERFPPPASLSKAVQKGWGHCGECKNKNIRKRQQSLLLDCILSPLPLLSPSQLLKCAKCQHGYFTWVTGLAGRSRPLLPDLHRGVCWQ